MIRSARSSGLFLLLAALAACTPEHYPMTVIHGRTYLEARDSTGRLVRFSVDTGSDRSFLSRAWVESVGGRVVAGPPGSWGGIRLFAQWRELARNVPVPQGIPPFLEGLPVARGGPSSPLSGAVATVGLLGTDVLWDWALDFRGDIPELIHGPAPEPTKGRVVRQVLFQDDGRFAVGVSESGEGGSSLPSRAIVDTGSSFPAVLFQRDPPAGFSSLENPRSPVTANGTPTRFFGVSDFRVGRVPFPVVVLAGQFDGPPIMLLGTPALQALGAVVDLRNWNLVLSPGRPEPPLTGDSPASWAWSATMLPGRGIRIDALVPGSALERRGLRVGDVVARLGGEPAAMPRSWLEERRVWMAFAVDSPTP